MDVGIEGIGVGHWTDAVARTGCTVVRLPSGTVASGEVRGGAPATREMALLDPLCTVDRVDAVVLSGGSAFGLAAADGVVEALEAEGVGFPTGAGPVPIVVALSVFDLLVGDGSVRPGPAQGKSALSLAVTGSAHPTELGAVGAGTGATTGKWRGRSAARAGGLGGAVHREGPVVVAALVVVNAFGDIEPVDAPARPGGSEPSPHRAFTEPVEPKDAFTNTTVGVVLTNARIDKAGCHLMARSAHDGLARAVHPTHTRVDGDAFVVAATGAVDPGRAGGAGGLDRLRLLATEVVTAAVRSVGPPTPPA